MLYLIGLGLHDERDISVKGKEAIEKCQKVYCELYTSRLETSLEKMKKFFGKDVKILSREEVEETDIITRDAKEEDVAFLVAGDPLTATTHQELILRCKKEGIRHSVIHSSSIFTAVAETGLQLYKFGKTTTIPFPEKNYFPLSPYETIYENRRRGLHTLVLLDVKPGKNMSAGEAIEILKKMEEKCKKNLINDKTKVVVLARAGSPGQRMWYGRISDIPEVGKPLHTLIFPGKLHFLEEKFLRSF